MRKYSRPILIAMTAMMLLGLLAPMLGLTSTQPPPVPPVSQTGGQLPAGSQVVEVPTDGAGDAQIVVTPEAGQ